MLIWQDPVPAVTHKLIDDQDIAALKSKILASGCRCLNWYPPPGRRLPRSVAPTNAVVPTAPAFALAPQKYWEVNNPTQLAKVLDTLEGIQTAFNSAQSGGKQVSLADLIVLGGCAGVEQAAKNAGFDVKVPFTRTHRRHARTNRCGIFCCAGAGCRRVPQLL
jgi:catalase-peroxidase